MAGDPVRPTTAAYNRRMRSRLPSILRFVGVAVFAALPLAAWAQQDAREQAEAKPRTPEPQVRRTVIEDDGARIEELRVRGAVRSITVQPKGPIKAQYEVLSPDAGHDLSAGPNSAKGGAGQRVWRVLQF